MKKKLISPDARARLLAYIYTKLSGCSSRCLFRLGKFMATIVVHTRNQLSSQSTQNIALCFPELSAQKQKKLVFDNIHHTCCNFFELAHIWHSPVDQVLARVTHEQITDSFIDTEKAKLVVVPHQGSWELLILWLANRENLLTLYKPTRNPYTNEYVLQSRSRNGAQMVPVDTTGLRKLLKGLKHKACCMVLPDQKPRANKSCITAPFFQHPADTSLLIKNLASKSDCDVFIASITRNLDQGDYSLRIEAMDKNKLIDSDEISATYLNQFIEQFIAHDVSQYQWTYRRFPEQVYQSHSSN